MLPGWTEDELLHECLVEPRRAYPPLPDLEVIERPGWLQLVTPSLRDGGLNEVVHSVLGDAEADDVIDATLARYRALGLRVRWPVTPECRPLDLGARLAARGLTAHAVWVMARATDAAPAPLPAGVTVELVDAASLPAYTAVSAEGWGVAPGPLAAVHAAALADPRGAQRQVLARIGGEPAAVAADVSFARSVYLMGAVVLPRFRGRGLYRALVAARLADAARRGIPLATSHARAETSAPILAALGFVTVCQFDSYAGR